MKTKLMISGAIALLGLAPLGARISPPIYFGGTTGTRVKVYAQNHRSNEAHVIFKYGDLITRAIEYKKARSDANVQIKFAIYKFQKEAYIVTDPQSPCYGQVMGKRHCGDRAKNLPELLREAARAGIDVHVIVHNGNHGLATAGRLKVHGINWGSHSDQQMHNKFLLVNHLKGDANNYDWAVYTTTANVDKFDGYVPGGNKDWHQIGVTVYRNRGLYDAYRRYFNIIKDHKNDLAGFQKAVREAHPNLNYADDNFRAYFYPMPAKYCGTAKSPKNAWPGDWPDRQRYNPIAWLFQRSGTNDREKKYYKLNMAYLGPGKTEYRGGRFYDPFVARLKEILERNKNTHIRIAVKTAGSPAYQQFPSFDNPDHPIDKPAVSSGYHTHAKAATVALSTSGLYFTIVGSTNAKWNGFCSKANNQLVIVERSLATPRHHPVYDKFKILFYDVLYNRNTSLK